MFSKVIVANRGAVASRVLRALNENYDVGRARMAVVGYADTQSLESNETEEGRRKNRRGRTIGLTRALPGRLKTGPFRSINLTQIQINGSRRRAAS